VEDWRLLLSLPVEELARIDVVVMNLLVAKSIPGLAKLDIPYYQRLADNWAAEVARRLPAAEKKFRQSPGEWKNDINFFRLGILCGYLDRELGIADNEHQRHEGPVWYTNPSDLFLNGVMDTRRGTCGNMATLHVAIGRRLRWPVSLACAGSHFICRYDDGRVTHNIEATQAGYGGFKSDPDEYLIEKHGLPPIAISSGSDLRALGPRELLGTFIGARGRHLCDTGQKRQAEGDFLLARWLFPVSRNLYKSAMATAVPRGATLFEPREVGSPYTLGQWLYRAYGDDSWMPAEKPRSVYEEVLRTVR
jgi:hypothetical protein